MQLCADTHMTFVMSLVFQTRAAAAGGRVCFGERVHWRIVPVRAIVGVCLVRRPVQHVLAFISSGLYARKEQEDVRIQCIHDAH
jgi:hypothetical protein